MSRVETGRSCTRASGCTFRPRNGSNRLARRQAIVGHVNGGTYLHVHATNSGRTPAEVRDAVSAIYGPVPLDHVVEYLEALHEIELVTVVR